MRKSDLWALARDLRWKLETRFNLDTAAPGTDWSLARASAGHCAAVAVVVSTFYGGTYVSAVVDGVSHWFNRIETDEGLVDLDLTGDQFGREPVRMEAAGHLFPGTRERDPSSLNENTLSRARLLASRLVRP